MFENKKYIDINQQCFAMLHQVNFLDKNLIFLLTVKVMGLNPSYPLKPFLFTIVQPTHQIPRHSAVPDIAHQYF